MQHAAHHRPHPRKRLEHVADQRQQQVEAALDLIAGQIQEALHIDLAHRYFVQRAQLLKQTDAQIALDQDVGPRPDRRQRAKHRLARIALDDFIGPSAPMFSNRRIQLLLDQHEHRGIA